MADEPNGSGDTGGQPPPPPLAPDAAPPPPLAAAPPPPLAAAPPPLAAPPPPSAPPASAGKSLPAGLIAGGVFALVLAIGAILYFSGVFGGRPAADPAKTGTSATAPAAPGAGSGPSSGIEDMIAHEDTEPCRLIVSELEADDTPLAPGQARNRAVVTTSGDIMWNGQRIDILQLRQYLDLLATMSPPPMTSLVFEPGVPSAQINEVREVIFRSLGCRYPPQAP